MPLYAKYQSTCMNPLFYLQHCLPILEMQIVVGPYKGSYGSPISSALKCISMIYQDKESGRLKKVSRNLCSSSTF